MKFKTLAVACGLVKNEVIKLEAEYERLEVKLDSTPEDSDEYSVVLASRGKTADKLYGMRAALNDLLNFEIN